MRTFPIGVILGALLLFQVTPSVYANCIYPYWSPLASFPTATPTFRISAPDLNGDNHPDLVASGAPEAYAAINGGTGTFGPPAKIATGTLLGQLTGDFNGDGKADVLLADNTANTPALILLAGSGMGTFAAPVSFAVPFRPSYLASGDFDGDGDPDVAIADASTGAVAVLLRTPTGFAESSRAALDGTPSAMVIGDVDHDGFTDLVVTASYPSTLFSAFFGRGDGTFDPIVRIPAAYANDVAAGDFDQDGFLDLAWTNGVWASMNRNLTGRLFGDPLFYTGSTTWSVAVADVNGDGLLDELAGTRGSLFSYEGRGTGLDHRAFYRVSLQSLGSQIDLRDIVAADFDGDGKIDVAAALSAAFAITGIPRVDVLRNRCGASTFELKTPSPVVTAGQTVTINAALDWLAGYVGSIELFTGTITLKEGATVLGTKGGIEFDDIPFDVSGLPVGEHTFTASYSGDEQHDPIDSNALVLRVTNDTSTTALTITPSPQYGQRVDMTANVASTVPGTATGRLQFFIDSVEDTTVSNGPSATVSRYPTMDPHTLTVKYLGDATHPGSTASTSFTVAKAKLVASTNAGGSRGGQTFTLNVSVLPEFASGFQLIQPSGTIRVSENGIELGSGTLSSGLASAYVLIPVLPTGRHYLRVSYAGDARFEPFDMQVVHNIFPAGTTTIDARGTANAIRVTHYGPGGMPVVARRLGNGIWTNVLCCDQSPWDDTGALPNTVYSYRMVSNDGATFSAADVAMRISFSDDPLLPGMTVRAVHLTEIITAANALRAAAGLSPVAFSIAPAQSIAASHVTALRTATNEARVALGVAPFPFEDTITPGVAVRALHIQELREAIR
jgi:hypothetical protein